MKRRQFLAAFAVIMLPLCMGSVFAQTQNPVRFTPVIRVQEPVLKKPKIAESNALSPGKKEQYRKAAIEKYGSENAESHEHKCFIEDLLIVSSAPTDKRESVAETKARETKRDTIFLRVLKNSNEVTPDDLKDLTARIKDTRAFAKDSWLGLPSTVSDFDAYCIVWKNMSNEMYMRPMVNIGNL